MSNLNLNNAVSSTTPTAYVIDSKTTDGLKAGTGETTWVNSNWAEQWGYFNSVPDLKSALLMKAIWSVGKGYTSDSDTKAILEHITGWGKDTFEDILFNMVVIARVGGDSYAQIVRDPETEIIVNLKPLDPSTIRIVVSNKGRIKRYEQIAKTGNKEPINTFEPEEILHFSHNRLADQIHGISDIDALKKTILADEQNFDDATRLMHSVSRPFIIFKLKTDDPNVIANVRNKVDEATRLGNNLFIPDDENIISYEQVELSVPALLFDWRNETRNRFYRAVGLPQIVPGASGQGTESESKVIYMAHENIVEREQRQIEEQLWQQMTIRIDLLPPISITDQMATDAAKDGAAQQMNMQPSDVNAGRGR